MRLKTGILVIALGTLVSTGGLVAGCSDDAPATADGGPKPTSTTTATGTTTTTPTGTGSTPSTTLYERLGKKDGIRTAIAAIVTEELKDPEIASYFVTPPAIGTAGRPTREQIEECFTNLLASISGGTEKYPGLPADNKGFQCRDMKTSHAGLGIPGSIFDRFVGIAGAFLKGKVSDADLGTIAGALNATRTDIVDTSRTGDGGAFVPKDAGGGG